MTMLRFISLFFVVGCVVATTCTRKVQLGWQPVGLAKLEFVSNFDESEWSGTRTYVEFTDSNALNNADAVHAALGAQAAVGLPAPFLLTPGTQIFMDKAPNRPAVAIWQPSVTPSWAAAGPCALDRGKPIRVLGSLDPQRRVISVTISDEIDADLPVCGGFGAQLSRMSDRIYELEADFPVSVAPWTTNLDGIPTFSVVDDAVLMSLPAGKHRLTIAPVPFCDFEPAADVLHVLAVNFHWNAVEEGQLPPVCAVALVRRPMPDFSMPLNAIGLTLAGAFPIIAVVTATRPRNTSGLTRILSKIEPVLKRLPRPRRPPRSPAVPWALTPKQP